MFTLDHLQPLLCDCCCRRIYGHYFYAEFYSYFLKKLSWKRSNFSLSVRASSPEAPNIRAAAVSNTMTSTLIRI